MTFSDECALSCYKQIAALDEEHNISIVQHKTSNEIYVKKILTVYNPEIYGYLKNNHIKGLPEIIETVEDDGKLIVIEEYISGKTLRSLLDDGNRFSEKQAVETVLQLCEIVQRLHNASPVIVHRDIKPSNIVITSDGEVKLLDMNAARFSVREGPQDTALLGTVGYAAPEQYGFGTSGVQTDIYSIGILLNEMLIGLSPREKLASGRLGEIIGKCTKIDPKDRYSSVEELTAALKCYQDADGMPAMKKVKYNKWAPPGFRSSDTTHMAIALIGYVMLFIISLTMTVKNAKSETDLWLNRIASILSGLAVVGVSCNYLDIWNLLRIDRIKNRFLRLIAVIFADAAVLFIVLLTMSLIESGL